MRHKFKPQRVGSDARSREVPREIGDTWNQLGQREKEFYQRQADQMQLAREQLQGQTLSGSTTTKEAADAAGLSLSQAKRLHGPRLDKTLQAFADHDCWKRGLGLSDHISALRSSLVLPVSQMDREGRAAIKEEFHAAFSYDANVEPNWSSEAAIPFNRACCALHGGVCQQHVHFDLITRMIADFDAAVQKAKLGADPLLVRMTPLSGHVPEFPPETWVAIVGVSRRPLCHTILHLHKVGGSLRMSLRHGVLHLGTMHRTFRTQLGALVADGGAVQQFSLQVSWHVSL